MEPWFYAFDHLAVGDHQPCMGDGAIDQIQGNTHSAVQTRSGSRRWWRVWSESSSFNGNNEMRLFRAVDHRFVLGIRIVDGTTYTHTQRILGTLTAGGGLLLNLAQSGGQLLVRRGTTVLETIPIDIRGVESYVELVGFVDDTDGVWEVWRDGVQIGGGTGDTGTGDIGQLEWGAGNRREPAIGFMTDFYYKPWASESEPAPYGPIILRWLDPEDDVAVDWEPSDGTGPNAPLVPAPRNAATYLDSETVGDTDEYTLGDVPEGVNALIALVRITVGSAPEGGAPQIRHGIRDGASLGWGGSRTIGTQLARTQATMFKERPGGGPWTVAAVDAANILRESTG
jgi:hypothetical protein